MKETGTINRIEGVDIFLSCGSAGGCKGCAAGAFCKGNAREIIAHNDHNLPLHKGDKVEIYLPPGKTIFSGFIVLIFPLLTFIAAFVLASVILPSSGEGVQALFGVGGLGAGFGLSYLYNKSQKHNSYPEITRKLKDSA